MWKYLENYVLIPAMQTLTKHIIEMGLANRVISETQLARGPGRQRSTTLSPD